MTDTLLCLNAGSSSIKFQLFEAGHDGNLSLDFKGQIDGIGAKPRLVAQDAASRPLIDRRFEAKELADAGAALRRNSPGWASNSTRTRTPTKVHASPAPRVASPAMWCRPTKS